MARQTHNYNWWDAIHSDLSGNGSNPCGYSVAAPCDDHGHGTHTTGTGIGDDGAGNQIGVAPGARWIACRNMEEGWGSPSTYLECFDFFLAPWDLNQQNPDVNQRPDVVGNSYTCPPAEGCAANTLLAAMDNLRAAGIFYGGGGGKFRTQLRHNQRTAGDLRFRYHGRRNRCERRDREFQQSRSGDD
jgi:serine protease AprX